ncbi:hypothetical protein DFJ73DRAFT_950166 [Zopfochytrium polystomum]|nr:hypothetical protein DFJ73DRAFT_950166 [Zopfochytrium polystomum]
MLASQGYTFNRETVKWPTITNGNIVTLWYSLVMVCTKLKEPEYLNSSEHLYESRRGPRSDAGFREFVRGGDKESRIRLTRLLNNRGKKNSLFRVEKDMRQYLWSQCNIYEVTTPLLSNIESLRCHNVLSPRYREEGLFDLSKTGTSEILSSYPQPELQDAGLLRLNMSGRGVVISGSDVNRAASQLLAKSSTERPFGSTRRKRLPFYVMHASDLAGALAKLRIAELTLPSPVREMITQYTSERDLTDGSYEICDPLFGGNTLKHSMTRGTKSARTFPHFLLTLVDMVLRDQWPVLKALVYQLNMQTPPRPAETRFQTLQLSVTGHDQVESANHDTSGSNVTGSRTSSDRSTPTMTMFASLVREVETLKEENVSLKRSMVSMLDIGRRLVSVSSRLSELEVTCSTLDSRLKAVSNRLELSTSGTRRKEIRDLEVLERQIMSERLLSRDQSFLVPSSDLDVRSDAMHSIKSQSDVVAVKNTRFTIVSKILLGIFNSIVRKVKEQRLNFELLKTSGHVQNVGMSFDKICDIVGKDRVNSLARILSFTLKCRVRRDISRHGRNVDLNSTSVTKRVNKMVLGLDDHVTREVVRILTLDRPGIPLIEPKILAYLNESNESPYFSLILRCGIFPPAFARVFMDLSDSIVEYKHGPEVKLDPEQEYAQKYARVNVRKLASDLPSLSYSDVYSKLEDYERAISNLVDSGRLDLVDI